MSGGPGGGVRIVAYGVNPNTNCTPERERRRREAGEDSGPDAIARCLSPLLAAQRAA